MELFEAITARRSVRQYEKNKTVEKSKLEKILQAGCMAPSGKNGQPWRFVVLQENRALLEDIAEQTVYAPFVKTADCLIAVLLDKNASYHYAKDCQGIGACVQNMLLAATNLGLGACWIGEILNRDIRVKQLLGLTNAYDLMAVLSIGYPKEGGAAQPEKKRTADCVLAWK